MFGEKWYILVLSLLFFCTVQITIKNTVNELISRKDLVESLSPLAKESYEQLQNLKNESVDYLRDQIVIGNDADRKLHRTEHHKSLQSGKGSVSVVMVPSTYRRTPQYFHPQPTAGPQTVKASAYSHVNSAVISAIPPRTANFGSLMPAMPTTAADYQRLAHVVRIQQQIQEEMYMHDEDVEQSRLERAMNVVRALQRRVAQAARGGLSNPPTSRDKAHPPTQTKIIPNGKPSIWSDKLTPLWNGVDVKLSKSDLEEPNLDQRGWEYYLWRKRDRQNHADRRLSNPAAQIKAATAVLAADRAAQSALAHGASTAAAGRAADRAMQGEIGELWNTTSRLWWEYDPTLHYRDLGPDGRPVPLRSSLVFRRRRRAPPAASAPPPPRAAAAAARSRPRCAGPRVGAVFCRFRSADEYLSAPEAPQAEAPAGGGPAAVAMGPADWAAGQQGADFVNSFPDTDDLRVLSWLAAEKAEDGQEADGAAADSMSAVGAQVGKPADWGDFPKARGFATHYGPASFNPSTRRVSVWGFGS